MRTIAVESGLGMRRQSASSIDLAVPSAVAHAYIAPPLRLTDRPSIAQASERAEITLLGERDRLEAENQAAQAQQLHQMRIALAKSINAGENKLWRRLKTITQTMSNRAQWEAWLAQCSSQTPDLYREMLEDADALRLEMQVLVYLRHCFDRSLRHDSHAKEGSGFDDENWTTERNKQLRKMAGMGEGFACGQTSGGGAPQFASSHDILQSMGELSDFANRALPDMPGTQVRSDPKPTLCLSRLPSTASFVWCFIRPSIPSPQPWSWRFVRFHPVDALSSPQSKLD
jgi:hypothetical protein